MRTVTYDELTRDGNPALQLHFILEECRNDGEDKLVIEKGTYELDPMFCSQRCLAISNHGFNGPKRIAALVEGMENFEIDFQGSTLVCNGVMIAVAVLDSKNITVRNLKLKNPTVPLLECRVTGYGEDCVEAEALSGLENLQLCDGHFSWDYGWDMNAPMNNNVEFDGETGEIAYGTADETLGVSTKKLRFELGEGSSLRIYGGVRKPPVGNVLNFSAIRRVSAGIFCQHSEGISFENVDVYSCYGMGLLAQVCKDITLNSFNTVREDGLMCTGVADATHFVNCMGLVKVENSSFVGQLDDALNIHGMYTRIVGKGEDWILIRQVHPDSKGIPIYESGDRIQIMPADTLLPYAEKTVKSVSVINDECFRLFLNESVEDINVGDDAENLTRCCDLIFRNCYVHDNRARGMLIGAKGKVLIEKCRFHSSGTAVKFECDGEHWYESGAVRDVTIRENHFENCKYGGWGHAIIEFQPRNAEEENRYFHGTVRVLDNTFTDGLKELVSINNAEEFVFRGNKLCLDDPYVCVEHVGNADVQKIERNK